MPWPVFLGVVVGSMDSTSPNIFTLKWQTQEQGIPVWSVMLQSWIDAWGDISTYIPTQTPIPPHRMY